MKLKFRRNNVKKESCLPVPGQIKLKSTVKPNEKLDFNNWALHVYGTLRPRLAKTA
jgi:hypothetical protein